MTGIDPREAASALSEIDDIVSRVRQSQFYNIGSLMLIMWGALIFAGYLVTYLSPRSAGYGVDRRFMPRGSLGIRSIISAFGHT